MLAKESQDRFRLRVALPTNAFEAAEPQPDAHPILHLLAPEKTNEAPRQSLWWLLLGLFGCSGTWILTRKFSPSPEHDAFSRTVATVIPGESPWDKMAGERIPEHQVPGAVGRPNQPQSSMRPPAHLSNPGAMLEKLDQADAVASFYAAAPEQLLSMWNLLQAIQTQKQTSAQRSLLRHLGVEFGSFKRHASLGHTLPIRQVASVTESLITQLAERAEGPSPQSLQTLANSLELLVDLCHVERVTDLLTTPTIRLLVVDDDPISCAAMTSALKRSFPCPDFATTARAAENLVANLPYDAIFLDILMPGIDGFELCSRVRQTGLNKITPVVFVSTQNDPETLAKSAACQGNDLIAKPFFSFELVVKALLFVLRARLQKRQSLIVEATVGARR
jgi:CheY-like chemotaxis protein